MKKLLRKHILVSSIMIVICLIVGAMSFFAVPEGVVDRFNYTDISSECSVGTPPYQLICRTSFHIDLVEIDTLCRKENLDADGELIKPKFPLEQDAAYGYGMIAVVKVQNSRNILIATPLRSSSQDYSKYFILSPLQTYNQYDKVHYLRELSHVRTRAEVLDVIYQTEQTSFTEGDTITVSEPYYIVDARVPNLLNISDDVKYQIYSRDPEYAWTPLEEGKTYLIFGTYNLFGGTLAPLSRQLFPYSWGIYCLSDPTKQAGNTKNDAVMQKGFAYIKEHYPDVYETYCLQ